MVYVNRVCIGDCLEIDIRMNISYVRCGGVVDERISSIISSIINTFSKQ